MLPPGDIRNCLVALAETETLMDQIFQHRFSQGDGLKGHNLGNLLLVAMTEITGDFISAIKEVSRVLAVRGRVLPATLEHVSLGARMDDGVTVWGETLIRDYGGKINRLFLSPECEPVPEALAALNEADAIIIGPGSLYTSIIPNLAVKGIADAIAASNAITFYVGNIMTEMGETDAFTACDHLRVIFDHVGQQLIDYYIVNTGRVDEARLNRYREEKSVPVKIDREEITALGVQIIEADLIGYDQVAWHDPDKLARVIMQTLRGI